MSDDLAPVEQGALAAGWAALWAAAWAGARAAFTAALAAAESAAAPNAPALDGLGIALWWLNEIDAAHRSRTAAYLAYKQQGQPGRAAVIAAWLAREQIFLNSNPAAMNGWFARAERLLPEAGEPEQAWVALYRACMLARRRGDASGARHFGKRLAPLHQSFTLLLRNLHSHCNPLG